MFRSLDFQATSFSNTAGILMRPSYVEHEEKHLVNNMHMATILPQQTRGNHRYISDQTVLILMHGRFLLRASKENNDGVCHHNVAFALVGLL